MTVILSCSSCIHFSGKSYLAASSAASSGTQCSLNVCRVMYACTSRRPGGPANGGLMLCKVLTLVVVGLTRGLSV